MKGDQLTHQHTFFCLILLILPPPQFCIVVLLCSSRFTCRLFSLDIQLMVGHRATKKKILEEKDGIITKMSKMII